MNVETEIMPPEADDDEGGETPAVRVGMHLIMADEVSYDAAVQLFGEDCQDPDKLATAMLNVTLGAAQLHGPDLLWAVQRRLMEYDGTRA